ncbi:hypothetical protein GOV07_03165, partial [Candidatus Woesearchaeota archaeon]|nr:hypothetical protein [Candidatus Woesearchaeota archaeon]
MDDAKELYMEYQLLTEQLKKIQHYLEKTTENLAELGNTIQHLHTFGQLKKGAQVFAPIANGIFIDVILNDPKHVRMNVGAKTVATKTIDEAKKLLEKQQHELHDLLNRAEADNHKVMT